MVDERVRLTLQEAVSMCDEIYQDAEKRRAHAADDDADRDGIVSVLQELADHKQRLAAQSARLAAAESEVRRLRRVIEDAPAYWGARSAGRLWLCVNESSAKEFNSDPVRCKLVPMDELEASEC